MRHFRSCFFRNHACVRYFMQRLRKQLKLDLA